MKLFLLIPLLLLSLVTPAFGQLLSDKTGLVNYFDVETSGHTFEIKVISNFDVADHEFDKDEKTLTVFINSSLENNLGEIVIPKNLLGGDLSFYLNDLEHFPKVKSNEKISFITLNFTGSGHNKLEIFGTVYLDGLIKQDEIESQETYIKNALQKGETLDDSLGWWALAGSLVIVTAFIIMKIKKRTHG